MQHKPYTIEWVSDTMITLSLSAVVDIAHQRKIWGIAAYMRASALYIDVVPGMNNLTIYFDPLQRQREQVAEALEAAYDNVDEVVFASRDIYIPVHYGGEYGPDLIWAAQHLNLSVQELVSLHTGAVYTVYFLGFQPGFAYMGGLDERLHLPRHDTPRLKVAKGSVGIAGAQTSIYPADSPGGWQIIGRTDKPLFDINQPQPTLLLPGDQVHFEALEVII